MGAMVTIQCTGSVTPMAAQTTRHVATRMATHACTCNPLHHQAQPRQQQPPTLRPSALTTRHAATQTATHACTCNPLHQQRAGQQQPPTLGPSALTTRHVATRTATRACTCNPLHQHPAGQQQPPTLGPSALTTRHALARRSMLSGVSFTSLLPSSILKSSSTASRRPFCRQIIWFVYDVPEFDHRTRVTCMAAADLLQSMPNMV
jgi:hypothetical protein